MMATRSAWSLGSGLRTFLLVSSLSQKPGGAAMFVASRNSSSVSLPFGIICSRCKILEGDIYSLSSDQAPVLTYLSRELENWHFSASGRSNAFCSQQDS